MALTYNKQTKEVTFVLTDDAIKKIQTFPKEDREKMLNQIIIEYEEINNISDIGDVDPFTSTTPLTDKMTNILSKQPSDTFDLVVYMALKDFVKGQTYRKYFGNEDTEEFEEDDFIEEPTRKPQNRSGSFSPPLDVL